VGLGNCSRVVCSLGWLLQAICTYITCLWNHIPTWSWITWNANSLLCVNFLCLICPSIHLCLICPSIHLCLTCSSIHLCLTCPSIHLCFFCPHLSFQPPILSFQPSMSHRPIIPSIYVSSVFPSIYVSSVVPFTYVSSFLQSIYVSSFLPSICLPLSQFMNNHQTYWFIRDPGNWKTSWSFIAL